MKEATGELNSAIIVVIAVGILSAFFFTILWPIIHRNFQKNINCDRAICDCSASVRKDNKCKCQVKNNKGDVIIEELWCDYKG